MKEKLSLCIHCENWTSFIHVEKKWALPISNYTKGVTQSPRTPSSSLTSSLPLTFNASRVKREQQQSPLFVTVTDNCVISIMLLI